MDTAADGIVLIDKLEGETSFDVVRKVRRILGGGKQARVGHAGTLDPFATGLLVVLLGQGTKLSRFLMGEDKVYRGTMRLGVETDSLDATGRVVRVSAVPELSLGRIQEAAREFEGTIEQRPPAFSAVKVGGQRAYRLARKGVDLVLPKKKVTVHALRILAYRSPAVELEVVCGSGTYVRSLAADLGRRIGTGAHLTGLRRVASGAFRVADALSSGRLVGAEAREGLEGRILPLAAALPGFESAEIPEAIARRVRQGYAPRQAEIGAPGDHPIGGRGYVKLLHEGKLVAITEKRGSGEAGHERVSVIRVFH